MSARYKPGDKVRMLHDRAVAKILQVYPKGRLLILIDDFIEEEVDVKEVVPMTAPPPQLSKREQAARALNEKAAQTDLKTGIYFAIDVEDERKVQYYLVNHSPYGAVFALSGVQNGKAAGKVQGMLDPATAQILFRGKLSEWETHSDLLFQFIYFSEDPAPVMLPAHAPFRLRNKHFMQPPQQNPYTPVPSRLVCLLTEQQIKDSEYEKPETETEPAPEPELAEEAQNYQMEEKPRVLDFEPLTPEEWREHDCPDNVIDLHIEKLVADPNQLYPSAMLNLQLQEFEKCMSLAVANGLKEICFIHGIGAGKLKKELHRRLKGSPYVREFKVDDSGRFGFGATKVSF